MRLVKLLNYSGRQAGKKLALMTKFPMLTSKMLESVFAGHELVPMTGFIENLRMIRDEQRNRNHS